MQRWEYIELCLLLTDKGDWIWEDTKTSQGVSSRLTQMGRDGWELVSAYPQTSAPRGVSYTKYIYYIFKRPLAG